MFFREGAILGNARENPLSMPDYAVEALLDTYELIVLQLLASMNSHLSITIFGAR